MTPDLPDPPSEAERRDLAALADGSLSPARRERLERLLERSSELRAELELQQQALEATRVLGAEARAPARLRARVEAERTGRGADQPHRACGHRS